ncbi:LamG domain-containing protein [Variovorax sp. J22G73]|uniref:LamG domain-containing protein n=1 Tax=unclassified Variovorax TaxID=663243 RepID=UPI0025754F4F|nr:MULTISPECIES: LamG domain-containing protein [unclassified Variovorax]MDM0003888.1 LamG domain-containing protein [Variovorax sp. J22R203]MDM0096446.1 LamG domain-containing protein [Variovorax sp. J22G73]
MAAHRYWRAVSVQAKSAQGLELSELRLVVATAQADAAAVLTSNVAPASGTLANLKDDDLGTGAAWSAAAVAAGVEFYWDFGVSPQDVSDMAVGAAATPEKFLYAVTLQWSDNGTTWTTLSVFFGLAWPGVRARLSSVSSVDTFAYLTRLHLPMAGSFGDLRGHAVEVVGGASFSAANLKFNPVSGLFNGTGRLNVSFGTDTLVGSALDFTVEAWVYITSLAANPNYIISRGNSGYLSGFVMSLDGGGFPFIQVGTGSGEVFARSPTTCPLNAWVHLAGVRSGSALTMYVNGVAVASASAPTVSDNITPVTVGFDPRNSARGFVGQLFDVRFTQYARYTAAFVPPAVALPRYQYAEPRIPQLVRMLSAASVPMVYGETKVHRLHRARKDYLTGVLGDGIGRVRGFTLDYVNPLNKPYACRVRLVRETDGLVMREQWSKADGSYDFQYVDELQGYTVLAYYEAHGKRAVVADGLTLANGKVELMA